jgi:hypothetical protein
MNPCVDYTHKGVSLIVKDDATLTWRITIELDYTHKGASLIVKDESTLTWSQEWWKRLHQIANRTWDKQAIL